jgi:hypothetical protein
MQTQATEDRQAIRQAGTRPEAPASESAPASFGRIPFWFFVVAAMACGLVIRLPLVLAHDFPLGDGGMFYVMAQNLLANHFVLPMYTSFNNAHIPFAYPPLGFYLVDAVHELTGASLFQIFRFFPLGVSLVSIPAFAILARAVLQSRTAAIAATFAFAILPSSFHEEIKGGGITRSFGELFALLALGQMALLYRTHDRKHVIPATVFASLTLLSHLEWTWFAAYSVVLLFIALGRNRTGAIDSVLVAVGAAALTAPWWVLIAVRHGVRTIVVPFGASGQAFTWVAGIINLFSLHLTDESRFFPLGTALALAAVAVCIKTKRWMLPGWLLSVWFVSVRGPIDVSVVPVALLDGVAVEVMLLPILLHFRRRMDWSGSLRLARPNTRRATIWLGLILVVGMFLSWNFEASLSDSISSPERAAMSWAALHTTRSSTFLVITSSYWAMDGTAEWFPALSGRRSVSTVQGNEWIPGAFAARYSQNADVQLCAQENARCLARWFLRTHVAPGYVYVSKRRAWESGAPVRSNCCAALRASLDQDQRYLRVFDNPAATIYRRV